MSWLRRAISKWRWKKLERRWRQIMYVWPSIVNQPDRRGSASHSLRVASVWGTSANVVAPDRKCANLSGSDEEIDFRNHWTMWSWRLCSCKFENQWKIRLWIWNLEHLVRPHRLRSSPDKFTAKCLFRRGSSWICCSEESTWGWR